MDAKPHRDRPKLTVDRRFDTKFFQQSLINVTKQTQNTHDCTEASSEKDKQTVGKTHKKNPQGAVHGADLISTFTIQVCVFLQRYDQTD